MGLSRASGREQRRKGGGHARERYCREKRDGRLLRHVPRRRPKIYERVARVSCQNGPLGRYGRSGGIQNDGQELYGVRYLGSFGTL